MINLTGQINDMLEAKHEFESKQKQHQNRRSKHIHNDYKPDDKSVDGSKSKYSESEKTYQNNNKEASKSNDKVSTSNDEASKSGDNKSEDKNKDNLNQKIRVTQERSRPHKSSQSHHSTVDKTMKSTVPSALQTEKLQVIQSSLDMFESGGESAQSSRVSCGEIMSIKALNTNIGTYFQL